jgi:type IX secretion system PorP/SprF family membrane protein
MKNTIIQSAVLSFGLLVSTGLNAQDVHFSNMEFSPLTLNPALAGANSPMQGIVNYRNQWNSVAMPYSTIAASFDARFNEKTRNKKGHIAGGINFFNDNAGDLKVTTNNVNVSLAYHLLLDENNTLGLGIYTGYGQRSVNPNDARWASQFDGSGFNTNIVSGETFNTANHSYLDAGAGLLYTYQGDGGYRNMAQPRVNVGLAFYHLNRPGYSFIDQSTEKLNMRISAFANATLPLSDSKGALVPGVYFQRQKTSMEILYGMYYRYQVSEGSMRTGFSKPMALSFGLFNRFKDAMVAKVMFEFDQYSAGFAYDINISGLNEVSKLRGGFELFLRFNMAAAGQRTRI